MKKQSKGLTEAQLLQLEQQQKLMDCMNLYDKKIPLRTFQSAIYNAMKNEGMKGYSCTRGGREVLQELVEGQCDLYARMCGEVKDVLNAKTLREEHCEIVERVSSAHLPALKDINKEEVFGFHTSNPKIRRQMWATERIYKQLDMELCDIDDSTLFGPHHRYWDSKEELKQRKQSREQLYKVWKQQVQEKVDLFLKDEDDEQGEEEGGVCT